AAGGPSGGAAEVAIDVAASPAGARVPGIGLTLAPGGERAPAATGARLRALGLEHVRVELREPERAAERLAEAADVAAAAGAALAVAVYLRETGDATVLADALRSQAERVTRLLVFARERPVTPASLVAAAREQLAGALPAARIATGGDAWFVELNRHRAELQAADGVAWSITPQVHGTDALTIVEALEAQADQVATARALAPGRDLLVGPVTLRAPYDATAPDAWEQALDPPPASVDPRQGDLFAAAWTAASLGQLAAAGATAATYYETSGPRGVLGAEGRGVLPCWHPLADAGGWRGWHVLPARSADPLAAQALVARGPDGALGALVANLRDEPATVRLDGWAVAHARVRTLDARTCESACADPVAFRGQAVEQPLDADGALRLTLEPYAVATVTGGA
ncbi:MAG TPA: hypothetical protein VFS37_04590, partial [Conexibacter sp.]|nr:hypothetical protein [Conexibacter sp.]